MHGFPKPVRTSCVRVPSGRSPPRRDRMPGTDIRRRNNVTLTGPPDGPAVVLAHGLGCDQNTWRLIVPQLAVRHRVVLFDQVGCGASHLESWSEQRSSSPDGYARDVVEVLEELDLLRAVFVGHSVSAMVGVLAARPVPERIRAPVMVAPSPRRIDDEGYRGGFSTQDIDVHGQARQQRGAAARPDHRLRRLRPVRLRDRTPAPAPGGGTGAGRGRGRPRPAHRGPHRLPGPARRRLLRPLGLDRNRWASFLGDV